MPMVMRMGLPQAFNPVNNNSVNQVRLYPFNPSLEDELSRLFSQMNLPPVSDDALWEDFKNNGRDYEYCPDTEGSLYPSPMQVKKKNKKPLATECAFCKNNGEHMTVYKNHLLKDAEGRVICPILRAFTCRKCGAWGDVAHTRKYCPLNKGQPALCINSMKNMRNSTGRRRSK